MKEKITKAEFINTWASEWDEITGWKVSEEYHKQFSEQLESLINQEVEKRIKERMPSEDEMDNEVDNRYPNVANPHIFGKQLGFGDCYFWLHSRLTCSEKPNNSQKTEGGEE